jgi:2-aminoadipate transaminase
MIDYDAFLSQAAARMQESAIRKMGTVLAQVEDVISFAPGYPAPEMFPWQQFQEIARALLQGDEGRVLQYGPTRGYGPLLEAILELQAARGVGGRLDELLVTTGSQQGLDLVARVLLDPGDVALVELPSYTGAITAFRNAQARLAGVHQQADGIDLDDLDAVLGRERAAGRRVRFLYVVPNFQNPTGLLIAREKRRALLEWADRRDVLIVEDDPYGDLYFEDSASPADTRPIKADDGAGRVIYLSSFSKTLAPGFRVGWIAAPAALASKFEVAKQASDLCSGGFDQRVVLESIKRGVLAAQVPRLRAHYQHKRDVMIAGLRAELGALVSWPDPRGGFFLWATLPGGVDAEGMLARAVSRRVIYVAGSAFFVDGGGSSLVRLSFSAPTPERIAEGVRRFALTVREELDAQTH